MIRYIDIGHFSLFKNNKKINESFMKFKDKNDKLIYKKVYSLNESFLFDETGKNHQGIVKFYNNKDFKLYNNTSVVADISIKYNNFIVNTLGNKQDGKYIFEYKVENNIGKLVGYYYIKNNMKTKEYMYIHLQKRKMLVKISNKKNYLIVPNSFIDKKLEKIEFHTFEKLMKKITIIRKEYIMLRAQRLFAKIKSKKLRGIK